MKKILLCCFFVLCMTGCARQNIPAGPVTACTSACHVQFSNCSALCTDNCGTCKSKSVYTAKKNFEEYVHEECVKGGFIARELNSYRDPLQCLKVSCNCCADLSVCLQACKGLIQKRLRAAPKCC